MPPLLKINGLNVQVDVPNLGWRDAVSDLSLSVDRGEAVGLVGESGCGKTLTVLSVLGLLPPPSVRHFGGEIYFDGQNLTEATPEVFRQIRGRSIGYVPQDPMAALNPVFTIGNQVEEAVRLHRSGSRSDIKAHTVSLLAQVGIPAPEERLSAYPHELSGGQRQRVLIAIALAGDPDLLVADEPTTALDVTVQAQVLRLLDKLRKERALSLLLVTHDLAVVSQTCDRVAVLYAGQCVENGPSQSVLSQPYHPYTRGLMDSLPGLHSGSDGRLRTIAGQVPGVGHWPTGCRFRDRCPRAEGLCGREEPSSSQFSNGRTASCHFVEGSHG